MPVETDHLERPKSKSKRFATAIAGSLLCSIASAPGHSFDRLDEFSDGRLDADNDWVIYVDTSTLHNYLTFRGSELNPIISVRIRYRAAPDEGKAAPQTSPQLYEELWYHNGTPVGSRRYSNLPSIRHKLGTVIVSCASGQNQETLAIANAIARLAVELDLLAAVRSEIVVPSAVYEMVATDLSRYKFFARQGIGAERRRVIIHLVSNPRSPTRDNYLVREDPT